MYKKKKKKISSAMLCRPPLLRWHWEWLTDIQGPNWVEMIRIAPPFFPTNHEMHPKCCFFFDTMWLKITACLLITLCKISGTSIPRSTFLALNTGSSATMWLKREITWHATEYHYAQRWSGGSTSPSVAWGTVWWFLDKPLNWFTARGQ